MRTWNNKLYLDAMPGRKKTGRPQGDFEGWLTEMREYDIGTVVCLATDEQIAAESPEYAEWLARRESDGSGKSTVEIIRLPIDDFSIPVPFQAPTFWKHAKTVATKIDAGEHVFVHCGAGFGRTGMFAVAVLMQMGYGYEDATDGIRAVGSDPETRQQREFVKRGPNGPDQE